MHTLPLPSPQPQRGTTLVEVLVTMVILAFGLLGIAAFQAKAQIGSIESYQRAQAVVLLEDLQARINTNSANAAAYVTATSVGTGDALPDDCTTLTAPITAAQRDMCEWSGALKGAAEINDSTKVGAMQDARGCITTLQAADAAAGVCRPAVYQLAVAWQGLHPTVAPAQLCGKNLYGTDTNRRTISVRLSVGLPTCK